MSIFRELYMRHNEQEIVLTGEKKDELLKSVGNLFGAPRDPTPYDPTRVTRLRGVKSEDGGRDWHYEYD